MLIENVETVYQVCYLVTSMRLPILCQYEILVHYSVVSFDSIIIKFIQTGIERGTERGWLRKGYCATTSADTQFP